MATYHLGYELKGEQPAISLHTHPSQLERAAGRSDDLAYLEDHLGLGPFTASATEFGFENVGRIEPSRHAAGWVALKLALPSLHRPESRYLGAPTSRLLPIVVTFSATLNYLNRSAETDTADQQHPQLITASLSNSVPLDQPYSAPFRASLSPALLERIDSLADVSAAEERVSKALFASFQYPYGHAQAREFSVGLGEEVFFEYPGDGTGFFARRDNSTPQEGLTLNAANNDYPLQQIALLGGLAALSDIALES